MNGQWPHLDVKTQVLKSSCEFLCQTTAKRGGFSDGTGKLKICMNLPPKKTVGFYEGKFSLAFLLLQDLPGWSVKC